MGRVFRKRQLQTISCRRLQCELLEDRRLLAVVTDQASLEAAIAAADPAIEFGNDIGLASEVVIDQPVNIDGRGFTLTGSGTDRVLNVTDGDDSSQLTVSITNLTITGGSATAGGGIANAEELVLDHVIVTGNVVYQGNRDYSAFGGGILNTGRLTIQNGSSISGNTAFHGPFPNDLADGGGIANLGYGAVLDVINSTVDGNSVQGSGGGIFHRLGTLHITDSVISNNTATSGISGFSVRGGGVAAYSRGDGSTSSPLDVRITGSTISGNYDRSDSGSGNSFPYGGGLYIRGYGSVELTNSLVSDNTVTGEALAYYVWARGGGAFFSGDGGAPLVVDVEGATFSDNTAYAHGGGLAVRGRTDSLADVDITNSTFTGGSSGYGGGGVFLWAPAMATPGSADVRIEESTIENGVGGSAIHNWFGGYLEIVKSTVSGNSGDAAAIINIGRRLIQGEYPPTTVLRDSTVSGNYSSGSSGYYSYSKAGGVDNVNGYFYSYQSTISGNTGVVGGGIYSYTDYAGRYEARTVIHNTTIAYNTATEAGGGWAQNSSLGGDGRSSIRNTVIAGNYDGMVPTAPDFLDGGSTYVSANMRYSLISDTYGSSLDLLEPSNKYDLAARFMPLVDGYRSSPTAVHAPELGSPLINMGDPAITEGMDQTMYSRVLFGRMDIGSVEYGNDLPVVCDVDGDGDDCDIDDVDTLIMQMIDYDQNGSFERADIQLWLADAGLRPTNSGITGGCPFLEGDFNLDGVVDGLDFLIWNANKFTATGKYSLADANGDENTDGLDFLIWNGSKFTMSQGSCVAGVTTSHHDALVRDDHDGSDQAFRRRGKDNSHAQFATEESLTAVGILQTVEPKVVDRVFQVPANVVSDSAFTAKSVDVTLGAVSVTQADSTTPSNYYFVKSLDTATARANAAHDSVDKMVHEISPRRITALGVYSDRAVDGS